MFKVIIEKFYIALLKYQDMLLNTLGKKKTESEYEKYIARVACSFFSLGILGLFIVRSNSLSDYALGLVMGVTIGSYALSIYYFAALRHSKRLHQMYIAAYDERNKQILQVTAVATLVLEFLWLGSGICSYSSDSI